jgi:hypothetical protein
MNSILQIFEHYYPGSPSKNSVKAMQYCKFLIFLGASPGNQSPLLDRDDAVAITLKQRFQLSILAHSYPMASVFKKSLRNSGDYRTKGARIL